MEAELGYRLPDSYIALMQLRNGGRLLKNSHAMAEPTSWARDHIAVEAIMGIGRNKSYSLGGEMGSRFWCEEWGYPDYGIYICDTPSAGHDMILLDYRKCGPDGEPEVVHVDQDHGFKTTFVAKDFETFIRWLVDAEVYLGNDDD